MFEVDKIYKLGGKMLFSVDLIIKETDTEVIAQGYLGSHTEGFTEEILAVNKETRKVRFIQSRPWLREGYEDGTNST